MKKLILLVALGSLLLASNAIAAWTCVEQTPREYSNGNTTLEVVCTADAGAGAYDISDHIVKLKGRYLYQLKIIPGTGDEEPTGTFDVDIEDEEDDHLLDTDANAADANTFHFAHKTIDGFPMIRESLSIVAGAIGADNTVTFRFFFANQ